MVHGQSLVDGTLAISVCMQCRAIADVNALSSPVISKYVVEAEGRAHWVESTSEWELGGRGGRNASRELVLRKLATG